MNFTNELHVFKNKIFKLESILLSQAINYISFEDGKKDFASNLSIHFGSSLKEMFS